MTTSRPAGIPAENYYRRFFERSPFGVLVADDLGRYIDANPAACRMLGMTHDEVLTKRVFDFVNPSEVVPTVQQWSKFRDDHAQTGEFRLRRPDGEVRTLRYHAVADFWPGVHVSFIDDVT